jgi:hypothetical protein
LKPEANITRRPLKSRDTKWASAIASLLARAGVRPNAISVAGTVFAAGAGISFWFAGHSAHNWHWSVLLILAVCGMQCFAAPVFFHLTRFFFT